MSGNRTSGGAHRVDALRPKRAKLIACLALAIIFVLPGIAAAEELLIIAPDEFMPALAPLETHKEATGIDTVRLSLESIYANYWFSRGVDEPEQIKLAIEHYHRDHGVRYVMLVGDSDKLPVRWITRELDQPENVSYYFPSDLYYADLYNASGGFDTWNYDGDEYFGEHLRSESGDSDPYRVNADRADLHPDVAVGRVPASTVDEVKLYVAKVIKYEYLTYADTPAADWFHAVLLLAGGGLNECDCKPGIHFNDIQTDLGSGFRYTTFIDSSFFIANPNNTCRPCFCLQPESLADCMARTGLTAAQIHIFEEADGFTATPPNATFENIGFLAWHDHGNSIGDYTAAINNTDRFTIAFDDGCRDGAFAGRPPGDSDRFIVENLSYRTGEGHELKVEFVPFLLDLDGDGRNETYYNITGCWVNSTYYSVAGDRCGGGWFPTMSFHDDFDRAGNWVERGITPYMVNPPAPAPQQPAACDYDNSNPERKLFVRNSSTGEETGWIGMVGATMGAQFPLNGELESLFFKSYNHPHAEVGRNDTLGDLWWSMQEYWLEEMFDDTGNFDLSDFFAKYNESDFEYWCCLGVQGAMKYALFGDPSLRLGGIAGLKDTEPPETTFRERGWYGFGEVIHDPFVAVDHGSTGSPASGVRETRYRVDNGSWETAPLKFTIHPLHQSDGIHQIDFFSIDYLGNREAEQHATLKIDTYPPHTTVLLNGELPATTLCWYEDGEWHCGERGCYGKDVTVSFTAIDPTPPLPSPPTVSGIDRTEYSLDSGPWPNQEYTGPFEVHARDVLVSRTLYYRSVDNASNEESFKNVSFCMSNCNWWLWRMRQEARILSGLEEIIRFRMRQEIADTLPIAAVEYAVAPRGYPDKLEVIGVDENGKDGWMVAWDTREVRNGEYLVRQTVRGFPFPGLLTEFSADPVIYQEEFNVTVCNIPNSSYRFELEAGANEIDQGASVQYTLTFINKLENDLNNLNMICDTDIGSFKAITVEDNGSLTAEGLPSWYNKHLHTGETWTVHFKGRTKSDIRPGTVITSQALLTADTVPLLVSDDPSTKKVDEDYTAVSIKLINGTINGTVRDKDYGTPVAASVSLTGPVPQSVPTDPNGSYAFTNLPPGMYNLSVAVDSYHAYSPEGSVPIYLNGLGERIQVDFLVARNDTIPPVSSLARSLDAIVRDNEQALHGTAYDFSPGSGVRVVEVCIKRMNDRRFWNGSDWLETETWLLASGTTDWVFSCGGLSWDDTQAYALYSRATDYAGNVETPSASTTTIALPAPRLITPVNGSIVHHPAFAWSYVAANSYYTLQVDDSPEFSSPEIYVSLEETTYVPGELPERTYYWRVKAVDASLGYPESTWSEVWRVTVSARGVFDTSTGSYPSISGTHNGTITPSYDINVSRLYTYPYPGIGGHTEYVKIWNSTTGWNVTATWDGYTGDWHNLTFNNSFTLYANETYNYTIVTGSYPQIIHEPSWNATGGVITCTEFVDINGKRHEGWIPAIRLE
jgi:hypothetical protein